jgi:cell wall-associated NlpC family hydrolase
LRWLIIVVVFVLSGVLAGCASKPPASVAVTHEIYDVQANDVLFKALGLVGTPYRYGGNNPDSGFDCSGLIGYVYRESADLRLPRTVAEINKISAPDVSKSELQAGDLVIFATGYGKRPDHAGIYVGDGRFVHAPSRGGVVRMDLLKDKYWQRSYLNAKRPLADLRTP